MREVWLQTNRRALSLAIAVTTALMVCGFLLACGWRSTSGVAPWIRGGGWLAMGIGAAALGLLCVMWRRPRLACDGEQFWLYLQYGAPIAVPLDVVEGFLLGQGPSWLPGKKLTGATTANVVLRLARRAEDWARRDVHPSLGAWCDHYVTIRGAWCEPLSVELVQQLNERLAAAKRTRDQSSRGPA